jgi:hypothetical protein
MTAPTIELDRICAECRRPGATSTGICLDCTVRAMDGKPMKSAAARAVQQHWQNMRAKIRKGSRAACERK